MTIQPSNLSPLSDADLDIAQENLVKCLDAYDQEGEAGLEREMNRIHPDTGHQRIPIMSASHGFYYPLGTPPAKPPNPLLQMKRQQHQLLHPRP